MLLVKDPLSDATVNHFAGPALHARDLGKFRGFLSQPADRLLVGRRKRRRWRDGWVWRAARDAG